MIQNMWIKFRDDREEPNQYCLMSLEGETYKQVQGNTTNATVAMYAKHCVHL